MATSFLIPNFNWSNQFTYMHDLIEETVPPRAMVPYGSIAGQQKLTLYEDSQAYLIQAVYEIMNKNTKNNSINSALDFLKKAANNERNKELKALEEYKKELDKFPEEWKKNKEFKKAYENIKKINLQELNTNNKKLESFYLNLTAAINLIRKEEIEYLARLEQIVRNNNERRRKTRTILASDQYKYRAHGDIITLFRNMSGIAERAQATSISNKLVTFVLNYIKKFKINKKKLSEEELFSLCALILIDVERFVQEEYYKSMKENKALPDEINNEMIEKAFDRYLNIDEQQMSRLQKDIIEQDDKDLEQLMKSAKSLLGIKKINEIQELEKRRDALNKQNISITGKNRNAFYRYLKQSMRGKKIDKKTGMRNIELFTWEAKTDQSHYKIDELANILTYNAFSTAGTSAGSDTIVLGTVTGQINDQALRKQVAAEMKNMQESIEEYYNKISFNNRTRKDNYEEYFSKMNDTFSEEIQRIKEDLKNNPNINNLFIYHESLKLYSQFETREKNYFQGRDLNILNAFDQLYSAASLDAFKMPHRDILTTIAANLSELAVGKNLKPTLEKYFSIFAGLLMFDDIRNIAKDAINRIENEEKTIEQIHLYKINDQYVPSSMVLTNIYNAIKKQGIITAENAAKVEINTDKANKIIKDYLNKRNQGQPYNPEEWDPIADEVIQGTQIQITFLASFFQFLKSLSNL